MHYQSALDAARRHVENGERRLAEYREQIAKIRKLGKPTAQAEEVLSHMLKILDEMRLHLRKIEGNVEPEGRPAHEGDSEHEAATVPRWGKPKDGGEQTSQRS